MACQVVLGDHPSGKICHSTARISQITTRACSTGLNEKKGGRWSTERTSEKEDPSGQLDTPDKPNFLSPRAIFHFLIHPGRFKALKPNNAQIRSDGQEQFRSVGRRQWCSTNIHAHPHLSSASVFESGRNPPRFFSPTPRIQATIMTGRRS